MSTLYCLFLRSVDVYIILSVSFMFVIMWTLLIRKCKYVCLVGMHERCVLNVIMVNVLKDPAVQQCVVCWSFFVSVKMSTSIPVGRLRLQSKYLHVIQYLYVRCIQF
jgi:hypothetical protein